MLTQNLYVGQSVQNIILPYSLAQCFSIAATHEAHVMPRTSKVHLDISLSGGGDAVPWKTTSVTPLRAF